MTKKILIIILSLFISSSAFAGGSDGSEILGPVKDTESGIVSAVKNFFKPKIKPVENIFDDEIMMDCTATPSVDPDYIPLNAINRSNNLTRKPGSARRANGSYIRIIGKVVDEDCLPVSNAVIQVWQTDSNGKYAEEYELKGEWDVVDENYDKAFAYSGISQTNNLGEFSFLTILPGMKNKELAPHINMYVKHPDFDETSTMMFFKEHPRNKIDKNLQSVEEDKRSFLTAEGQPLDPTGNYEGRVYKFNIVLTGVNKYRRF